MQTTSKKLVPRKTRLKLEKHSEKNSKLEKSAWSHIFEGLCFENMQTNLFSEICTPEYPLKNWFQPKLVTLDRTGIMVFVLSGFQADRESSKLQQATFKHGDASNSHPRLFISGSIPNSVLGHELSVIAETTVAQRLIISWMRTFELEFCGRIYVETMVG